MKLTPRQAEVLKWMEENDAITMFISGAHSRWTGLFSKTIVASVPGNVLHSLKRTKMIIPEEKGIEVTDYKISPLGVAALREYEEKGKKDGRP